MLSRFRHAPNAINVRSHKVISASAPWRLTETDSKSTLAMWVGAGCARCRCTSCICNGRSRTSRYLSYSGNNSGQAKVQPQDANLKMITLSDLKTSHHVQTVNWWGLRKDYMDVPLLEEFRSPIRDLTIRPGQSIEPVSRSILEHWLLFYNNALINRNALKIGATQQKELSGGKSYNSRRDKWCNCQMLNYELFTDQIVVKKKWREIRTAGNKLSLSYFQNSSSSFRN